MIASASSFKAFGIPMQRRRNRRRLVILTYLALAVISNLTAWLVRDAPFAIVFTLYSAVAVGIFVFGGQGRYGLIKPFLNRPESGSRDPIDRLVFPDPVRLDLHPAPPSAADQSWQNDERELSRRDRAHFRAFQPLAVAFTLLLLLASFALRPPRWLPLDAILGLIFVIALFASVLAVTLPAAIILWTEPDAPEPDAPEPELDPR